MVSRQAIHRSMQYGQSDKADIELAIALSLAGGSTEYSSYSNELLWRVARLGNKKALLALHAKVKGMWMQHIPVDPSRLFTDADWEQIAFTEFMLKWPEYDTSRGIRFSTYIYRVVHNRWINDLRAQQCNMRQANVLKAPELDYVEYASTMASQYLAYDESFMDSYFARFRRYLELELGTVAEKERSAILDVYQLRLYFNDFSVKKIAGILGQRIKFVQDVLATLKYYAYQFCALEKGWRGGSSVFG